MKNYLEVKNELIRRVEKKLLTQKKPSKKHEGLGGVIEFLEDKFDEKRLKLGLDLINDTLNQILEERKIDLEGEEKEKFIEFIKSTVTNLMIKIIKN